MAYGATSLGFVLAIAFWKTEVFDGLDHLSHWLRKDEHYGYAVLFCLIFLTTFPPLPLYSTLITLSGYTFGAWAGAVLSYCAALTGAIVVFSLSRAFLRESIARWLTCTRPLARAVRAVEKRPSLLFLVRLAPYPYNVLNALLAAAPTLTFRTYFTCTAISLIKVIVHTNIGASIRSFSEHAKDTETDEDDGWGKYWTFGGIVLCIALFVYLSIVARRAVDDELDDCDDGSNVRDEERVALMTEDEEAITGLPVSAPPSARPSFSVPRPTTGDGLVSAQLLPSGIVLPVEHENKNSEFLPL